MSSINSSNQTKNHTRIKLFRLLSLAAVILLSVGCNNNPPGSVTRSHAEAPTRQNQTYATPLTVGNNKINVAIMRTTAEQEHGLSGSDQLRDDQGMLFAFDHELTTTFWMKQMKFNLDLIWISNGKIVSITENVPAPPASTTDSQLPLYYSPGNIDQVLEVNAGWSKQHNVKVGDKISL